jgi:GAF domain-containing protein
VAREQDVIAAPNDELRHPTGDETQSAHRRAVEEAIERVPQMLRTGVSHEEILTDLVTTAEALAGEGATSSILVLDEHGLLRNGASPNLPADYLAAIDGLKPDPMVGTCSAAAATGCVVMTPDFMADDKWAELRHLPLALGFVGAWSVPIKSRDGTVLGTFGTYFRRSRQPTDLEQTSVELLAAAAALVLCHSLT